MGDEIVDEETGLVTSEPSRVALGTEGALTGFDDYLRLQAGLDERMPDAIMTIQGRPFRKKKYWRAVGTAFSLNLQLMSERELTGPSVADQDWGYEATYRATSPDGRFADGDGSCCASEKARGQDSIHNVRAHAHTRAKNRAIADLVGFGEVSAEEMMQQRDDKPAEPRRGDTQAPAGKVETWDTGTHKGVPVNKLPDDYIGWAKDKHPNKKWKAIAQAEADRRGHAPEPEKEEDPVLSTEDRKPMVAESYDRARMLLAEVSEADGTLKYDEDNALAASIRKRAMEQLGLDAASIRKSNEAPMIAAIKSVGINADGETEIPGELVF